MQLHVCTYSLDRPIEERHTDLLRDPSLVLRNSCEPTEATDCAILLVPWRILKVCDPIPVSVCSLQR